MKISTIKAFALGVGSTIIVNKVMTKVLESIVVEVIKGYEIKYKESKDVVFQTRTEAMEVLDDLKEIIDDYGVASVADFKQFAGITGKFTDNKYGWKDLSNAKTSRTRDGYIIKLPETIELFIKPSPRPIPEFKLVLTTKEDAKEALNDMKNLISDYGHVSFGEARAIIGEVGEYLDSKYGWTDISEAHIEESTKQLLGENETKIYTIVMPKASLLETK